MNVRIDYQSGGSAPPPRRSPGPQGKGPERKPRKRKDTVMLGFVGVGLAAAVVALVASPGEEGRSDGGGRGAASSAASAEPSEAAGLPRGAATASGRLGKGRVAGAVRGFPRTRTGAVEAAASAAARTFDMFRMPKEDRAAYLEDVYLKAPVTETEERGSVWRAQNSLDDSGRLTNPATGELEEGARFTSLCHPKLGAYKAEDIAADKATISVWYPCLTGVITPEEPGPLEVQWTLAQFSMSWHKGDWRIVETSSGLYGAAPAPPDTGQPAVSYEHRAKLLETLGGGWELFRDATAAEPAELKEAEK